MGRQRRREVVMLKAARYDELMKRQDAVRDLARALLAEDRIAAPQRVQVVWAGPRDDGLVHETAAKRLGRL